MSFWRKSQYGKDRLPIIQDLLAAMRMEGRGGSPGTQQLGITLKHLMPKRRLVVELTLEIRQVKLLTVDRAIVSRLVDAGLPAARACQAVKVNARYTDQRQHNCLGSHE